LKPHKGIRQGLGHLLRLGYRFRPLYRAGQIVAAEWSEHNRRSAVRKVCRTLTQPSPRVLRGPFEGMQFPHVYGGVTGWLQKLLGSYESELHPTIERLCCKGYREILNVGSAEGFYAVGFARRLPRSSVIAFEMNPGARLACSHVVALNDCVSRVDVREACEVETLRPLTPQCPGLVISDCEGAEFELLMPGRVPWLASQDLLVEVHDVGEQGRSASETLIERFENTHRVTFVNFRPSRPIDMPELHGLSQEEVRRLLDEERATSVGWVVAECKS
jgi:hypothetical protein